MLQNADGTWSVYTEDELNKMSSSQKPRKYIPRAWNNYGADYYTNKALYDAVNREN